MLADIVLFVLLSAPDGDDPSWIWFVSRENAEEGAVPTLVLTGPEGERRVAASADCLLISYLADRCWGAHSQLSISLDDTNRVLFSFPASELEGAAGIERAELVLDMRISRMRPSGPFSVAAHAVTSGWRERETTWSSQPTFETEAIGSMRLSPEAGIVRLDLTELVRSWADGTRPNEGVLLKVEGVVHADPVNAASMPSTPSRSVPALTFPYELDIFVRPLPWPHQAPGMTPGEIAALERDVWVINDFPLYQADAAGEQRYFHGGLDIVLPNGTPVYAVEEGWVKARIGDTVVVAAAEDDRPAYGWSYSHVDEVPVEVGERVEQGDRIGSVRFDGLEHTHVTKVFSQGPHWARTKYVVAPYAHFAYEDDEPPTIAAPFHFFPNDGPGVGDGEPFARDGSGRVTISGAVDVVVGMRDGGRWAHAKDQGRFGDRLAVARIEYTLRGPGGEEDRRSFDFERIRFRKAYDDPAFNTEQTRTVFKHWIGIETERPHGDKVLSYYVITNHPTDAWLLEPSGEARRHAWDTTLGPNGVYEVEVTAWDFKGNRATAKDTVVVENE